MGLICLLAATPTAGGRSVVVRRQPRPTTGPAAASPLR